MLIFVFGSNLAGRHGKGAAKVAHELWGAKYGRGKGLEGHSYAIPTKDEHLNVLKLEEIKLHVDEFVSFAMRHPFWYFFVTRIGTGLAGYHDSEIAPMFRKAGPNCHLSTAWVPYL